MYSAQEAIVATAFAAAHAHRPANGRHPVAAVATAAEATHQTAGEIFLKSWRRHQISPCVRTMPTCLQWGGGEFPMQKEPKTAEVNTKRL